MKKNGISFIQAKQTVGKKEHCWIGWWSGRPFLRHLWASLPAQPVCCSNSIHGCLCPLHWDERYRNLFCSSCSVHISRTSHFRADDCTQKTCFSAFNWKYFNGHWYGIFGGYDIHLANDAGRCNFRFGRGVRLAGAGDSQLLPMLSRIEEVLQTPPIMPVMIWGWLRAAFSQEL